MNAQSEKAPIGAALITGASGGIGYELAKRFARDGYNLVLVARNQQSLSHIAAELFANYGVPVKIIIQDLSLSTTAQEVLEEVQRSEITVGILVNNAGVGTYGLFAETPLEDELRMMQLNMVSLTQMTKLFVRKMLKCGRGKILNVASTAAFQPGPLMAVYYATKAYVLSFSEALANELEGSGVTVSVLCPGPTYSDFQVRAGMEASKLFSSGVMKASDVAEIGYRGLMHSKRLIIPGLRNKILAWSVRLGPRKLVPSLVRLMQEPRNGRALQ